MGAHRKMGRHVTVHVHVFRHIIYVEIPGGNAGLRGVNFKRSLKKATKEAISGDLPIDTQVKVWACTCMSG